MVISVLLVLGEWLGSSLEQMGLTFTSCVSHEMKLSSQFYHHWIMISLRHRRKLIFSLLFAHLYSVVYHVNAMLNFARPKFLFKHAKSSWMGR